MTVRRYIVSDGINTAGGTGVQDTNSGVDRAYASMNEWDVAEADDYTLLLDNHHASARGSVDDTTAVTIGTDWILSATYDLLFDGGHNSLVWDGNNFVLSTTNAAKALFIEAEHVKVKNLQVFVTANDGGLYHDGIRPGVANIELEYCHVRGAISGVGTRGIGIFTANTSATRRVKDCLVRDFINGAETCHGYSSSCNVDNGVLHYNCGAYNCLNSFSTGWKDTVYVNCWSMLSTNGWSGQGADPSTNNASDIASDAPGTNPQTGSISFVDAAGGDFNLASGDTIARGNGVGPGSDSEVLTTDANGNPRSGTTCDIGPAEYVAAGTTITPSPATAIAASLVGSIVLGSVSISPPASASVADTVTPIVIKGDLAQTPTPASAIADSVTPAVIKGNLSLTPTPASAIADSVAPVVIKGSWSFTPGVAEAFTTTVNPTVNISGGNIILTPTPASASADTVATAVIKGSLSLSPTPASAVADTVAPTVSMGGVFRTPSPASASINAVNPTVIKGSLSMTPGVAFARGSVLDPSIVLSSLSLTPGLASAGATTAGPSVTISDSVAPTYEVMSANLKDALAFNATLTDITGG